MATFVNPLDFEEIISYALGDVTLFIFTAMIGFSILAGIWGMPTMVYFILMWSFSLLMFILNQSILGILITIIVGIPIFISLARMMKQ